MRGPVRRMERHRSKQQISECKHHGGGGNGRCRLSGMKRDRSGRRAMSRALEMTGGTKEDKSKEKNNSKNVENKWSERDKRRGR